MTEKILNFTKTEISKLLPTSKRYHVSDLRVPALKLTVFPTGVKTFNIYRKLGGVSRRYKIGRFPDITIDTARKEAERLVSLITLGGNPQAEKIKERNSATFKDIFDYYYHQHLLKFTKNPQDNKRMMEFRVFPLFGNQKAKNITGEQVRTLHTKIGTERSKSTANRIITIISATYNFCIKESYISCANPCHSVRKYSTTSRDRFLTYEELGLFFSAPEEEEPLFQDFFKLLLYTGARKSNVLSMAWQDINLDLKRWRIPESQTKNKDINIVALPESAIEILKNRLAFNNSADEPSAYVFPSYGSAGHLNDPKRAFNRIREHMKVKDIRIHDLRRTLGSYMAISGASLPIIGKALNHKSQVSTAIYARLSQDPVLEAINRAMDMITNKGKLFPSSTPAIKTALSMGMSFRI